MIVSGCTGSLVATGSLGSECAESPEPEVVMHFESGRNSVVVHLVFECFWCSVEVVSGALQPNLPLCFCKWDSSVPITLFCFWW